MPSAGTHYEQAFTAYLDQQQITYTHVDQHHKALLAGEKLKSFDFIVYPAPSRKILFDVKGRKLARGSFDKGRYDQTWVSSCDIRGLSQWSQQFGPEYIAAIAFAYWVQDDATETWPFAQTERFEHRDYFFIAVELNAYRQAMTQRSQSWETVHVTSKKFKQIARPLIDFLQG